MFAAVTVNVFKQELSQYRRIEDGLAIGMLRTYNGESGHYIDVEVKPTAMSEFELIMAATYEFWDKFGFMPYVTIFHVVDEPELWGSVASDEPFCLVALPGAIKLLDDKDLLVANEKPIETPADNEVPEFIIEA